MKGNLEVTLAAEQRSQRRSCEPSCVRCPNSTCLVSGVLGNLKFHLDGYAVFQTTGPSKERTRRGCRMLSRRRLSRDCAKFLSACYAVLSGRRSWIAIAEWLWQHLYP